MPLLRAVPLLLALGVALTLREAVRRRLVPDRFAAWLAVRLLTVADRL